VTQGRRAAALSRFFLSGFFCRFPPAFLR